MKSSAMAHVVASTSADHSAASAAAAIVAAGLGVAGSGRGIGRRSLHAAELL
jgi:uncharacterized membrane protein YjjB (DUF3815 family)